MTPLGITQIIPEEPAEAGQGVSCHGFGFGKEQFAAIAQQSNHDGEK
jgi:hypothetical protein